MGEYDFDIEYIKGPENVAADFASRSFYHMDPSKDTEKVEGIMTLTTQQKQRNIPTSQMFLKTYGYSEIDLSTMQQQDEQLNAIYQFLTTQELPENKMWEDRHFMEGR